MAYSYGFGKLEDEFIAICENRPIDFCALEELIRQGANLNAVKADYDDEKENILSTVIDYAMYYRGESEETAEEYNARRAEFLKLVQFFLDNGFNLNAQNGEFGSKCLYELVYEIDVFKLSVAKKLIRHGAKLTDFEDRCGDEVVETYNALTAASEDASYESGINCDPAYGCLQYAYYTVLNNAFKLNRDYTGIEYMTAAEGRKIKRVFAINPKVQEIFFTDNGRRNCFKTDLCFELEEKWLYISHHLEIYADNATPADRLTDVSEYFEDMIGKTIDQVYFEASKYSHNIRFDIMDGKTFAYPADAIHIRLQEDKKKVISLTHNWREVCEMPEIKDENGHEHPDYGRYYAFVTRRTRRK